MNRRNFLKLLSSTALTALIVPSIPEIQPEFEEWITHLVPPHDFLWHVRWSEVEDAESYKVYRT